MQDIIKEARRRMEILDILPNVILEFERKNLLNYSDRGILFWVENEEWLERIHLFEEKYNTKVYHVIHNQMEFGECLACLYISSETSTWSRDRDDLREGIADACVINLDEPSMEIGTIGVKPFFGGVLRTA